MIQDLKDLQKLFKMCRSQGVTEIKCGGVEIKFGDMPQDISVSDMSSPEAAPNKYAGFPQGELSPEQLIFYSSGGLPSEDPENKETA